MKYFGFIKEHDNYDISKTIDEMIVNNSPIDNNKDLILQYLQKGVMAIPLMGCVENAKDPLFGTDAYDDENFIAYNMIYSDGVWLWPQYIIEYIKKYPNIKFDTEFINHVLNSKNKIINLSEDECLKIEKDFYNTFWK